MWNLFGKEADMFKKTWNVSVKNMFQISVKTHKYLIEPISNSPHLKSILIKRFLSFIETRPEVSEGGPAITNLIQQVAREEADRNSLA